MTIESIIDTVELEFKYKSAIQLEPSSFKVFVFYMVKSGMILYNDTLISHSLLMELLYKNKLIYEGLHVHQCEKSIRYAFKGFDYPAKFYRDIPKELREQVLYNDDYRCTTCGSENDLCIDHIFPWSKGGLTELHNLQTLFRTCNSKKKNKI